ncbi:PREDICTED: putative receptor-like protein kinase At1g80870 [Nelumbo nucifera]|uniref:non-specific serine/threonine protein kinase n=2 Tax=Nelumbo nucifera TaxID=4432 RepID=A0A822Y0K8_NELNU|nr:PREDICTED: putative receptor-like protein kinase At1g80870 [Nelumbo nucifera]DAD27444.1 TPA_asm: hypothetical protein HUJ06_028912 [Nelumbo nucifera]
MPSRPLAPSSNPSSILRARGLFLAITISASALFFIGLIFFLFYLWYSLVNRSRTSPFDSSTPLKLQRFSYRELKSATNGFNDANSIGKGGSGTVFRGILRDGKSVAVKKLDASSLQVEREFQNELQILGGLRSPFVISLLGYCVHEKRRFLVYEYMPNRSLQESLFGDGSASSELNWDRRFEIILDIARALAFLHLECDPPVIHGDIKPSNVLLSSDYRAKISDFGLSRFKTEGEFGIDLFSQELGRSQELWKSQELSGNPASAPAETPTDETPVETAPEVDFSIALQASSSSYSNSSKVVYNAKTLNSNSLNPNTGGSVNEDGAKDFNAKGKAVLAVGFGGEDWNKFVPFEYDPCSSEHSKELNLNTSLQIDDTETSTKQWGKDWWWRQDGSGELCSKDYVMEWIGSQIFPSTNPDWDDEKKSIPEKTDLDNSTQTDKLEIVAEPQLQGLIFDGPKKRSEKKEGKSGKKSNKKHRKMQEWWKEERLAEMSKKGSRLRKLEAKWKKGFKIPHFDLGRTFRFQSCATFREQKQNDCDTSAEFSFRKGWKKKKTTHSAGSEMWSGDLFSRELSSTTSVRGTVCYVAPEYGGCGCSMEKADIYSLGVVILVIISGRRPLHVLSSPMKLERANLISWCRNLARAGNILELVDEKLKDTYNRDQATLCINIALMCLQKMPELRPDIGEIVKILQGEMDLPPLPFEFSLSPASKAFSRLNRKLKEDVE